MVYRLYRSIQGYCHRVSRDKLPQPPFPSEVAESTPIRSQLRFGPFTADLRSRELLKHGIRIKLQDRPFEILALLLERPGNVVMREEIRARLWPDGTFVDFDNNISSAMGKLRVALADSAATPRYIETVGRGYRFVAEVTLASTPDVNPALHVGGDTKHARSGPLRHWRAWAAMAAGLFVMAGFWVAYSRWPRSRAYALAPPAKVMLAVLPFSNLTGDTAEDYFSDGFTEEMITRLGRLDPQHLGVIARTSVMQYKNSQRTLAQVGAELGVQYVLEGSVRRQGSTVRVTAQLISVRDQTHVWAQEYDRELRDLLLVQAEIAQEIGDEIQLALDPSSVKFVPASRVLTPQELEAYDLYLKGEYFFSKRTVPGFHKALEYFQQATRKDPGYARAYAGLADCYALLGGYSGMPQAEYVAAARDAALHALQLDDRLPDAHTALALITQNYDWDWQTAEKEFRRAIDLDPNYATAHHWYAEHLMWRGRFDEALQESEKARQSDPMSLIIAADHAVILFYSRQYDRAIQQFHSVLDLDPKFSRASMITYAYVEKRMFAEALTNVERQRVPDPGQDAWYWSQIAYINGRAGRDAEARRALEKLQQRRRQQQLDAAVFVFAYLGMGENDQAIAWLEEAYAQHSNIMITLKVDPAFDPLRSDPRFQQLLERVGFVALNRAAAP